MGAPPLRYLSAADVVAAMPPVEDRIALARRTMIALVDSAELPPKIGVHPRQPAAHTAAMPALLRESEQSGVADLLGVKWVTAFPGNRAPGIASRKCAGRAQRRHDRSARGNPRWRADYRAAHRRRHRRGAPRVVAQTARREAPQDVKVALMGAGVRE